MGVDRTLAAVLPSVEGRWSFVMLNVDHADTVWQAIRKLDGRDRPILVRDLFWSVLRNLDWNTGEVLLSRRQLAHLLGCTPTHVSHAMSVLERLDVVRKDRTTGAGVRGGRMVTYRCNPGHMWRGDLETRQAVAGEFGLPQTVIAFPSKARRDRERQP